MERLYRRSGRDLPADNAVEFTLEAADNFVPKDLGPEERKSRMAHYVLATLGGAMTIEHATSWVELYLAKRSSP